MTDLKEMMPAEAAQQNLNDLGLELSLPRVPPGGPGLQTAPTENEGGVNPGRLVDLREGSF